jgi:hypothetical protein
MGCALSSDSNGKPRRIQKTSSSAKAVPTCAHEAAKKACLCKKAKKKQRRSAHTHEWMTDLATVDSESTRTNPLQEAEPVTAKPPIRRSSACPSDVESDGRDPPTPGDAKSPRRSVCFDDDALCEIVDDPRAYSTDGAGAGSVPSSLSTHQGLSVGSGPGSKPPAFPAAPDSTSDEAPAGNS